MSYDQPDRLQYLFEGVDFGAGDSTETIEAPDAGDVSGAQERSGRVVAVLISGVTEAFTQTTTAGAVQVGDGSDADAYFDTGLNLGSGLTIDESVKYFPDDGSQSDIPLDADDVTVTFVAPTGGTPAGIGDVTVVIDWF